MRNTRNMLMAELWACVIISLVVVTLYETEMLLPGGLDGNQRTEFMVVAIMEVFTICLIPMALRLFKFKKIINSLAVGRSGALFRWGTVRMMMICLPMVANTLFYYLFGFNVAFGYMGIIGLICLVFIYPSKSRCTSEAGSEE